MVGRGRRVEQVMQSVHYILACSNHNTVGFGILLSVLKVSSKTKGLHFTGANFGMLGAQLEEIPWEVSMEGKGGVFLRMLS